MELKILRNIAIFLSLLVATSYGCATNPVSGKSELRLVSDAQANKMGSEAYPQIRQEWGGDFNDPGLQEYVSEIGTNLAKGSHSPELPYQFAVTNSSELNAVCLPGGKIFITRGLLSEMENEAQLAAVLGHEVGHATARHAQRGMTWSIAIGTAANIASILADSRARSQTDSLIAHGAIQAGLIGASLIRLGYSREQEMQSDELGVQYMAKAGYHPDGAIQVQEILASKEKKRPSYFEALMRSHPVSEERVKHIRGYVYEYEPGTSVHRKGDGFFKERFKEKTGKVTVVSEAFSHHDEAVKAGKEKRMGDARREIDKAIEIAPDQAEFYITRGDFAMERKDYAEAEKDYLKAKEVDAGYYKSYAALGHLAKVRGKNDESIAYHKEAIKLNPGFGQGYIESGYAYYEKKDYGKAAEMLEVGTELSPGQGGAYNALGMAYERTGRPGDAYSAYQKAVRAAPDDASADNARKRLDYYDRLRLLP